jgi:hypothetical protein
LPSLSRLATPRLPLPRRRVEPAHRLARGSVMLPTLIYILDAIRRALQKLGRGISLFADACDEAEEFRRTMHRRYWHLEE